MSPTRGCVGEQNPYVCVMKISGVFMMQVLGLGLAWKCQSKCLETSTSLHRDDNEDAPQWKNPFSINQLSENPFSSMHINKKRNLDG